MTFHLAHRLTGHVTRGCVGKYLCQVARSPRWSAISVMGGHGRHRQAYALRASRGGVCRDRKCPLIAGHYPGNDREETAKLDLEQDTQTVNSSGAEDPARVERPA